MIKDVKSIPVSILIQRNNNHVTTSITKSKKIIAEGRDDGGRDGVTARITMGDDGGYEPRLVLRDNGASTTTMGAYYGTMGLGEGQ